MTEDTWTTLGPSLEIWCYYGVAAIIAFWELMAPRRELTLNLRSRWLSNIAFAVLNNFLIFWIVPVTAVLFAFELERRGWGLLNAIDAPVWIAAPLSFLFIDLCFYFKHRLAHAVPLFWRFHRLHHTDADFDFTTSVRFHPFDVAYQIALQMLAILAIGATPVAVITHILVFMVLARVQHGNIAMPAKLDRVLRTVLVTADMHRIHHSAHMPETNSNYAGVLSWWDRVFGTYTQDPVGGHEGMVLGIEEYQDPKHATLGWMLINPFTTPVQESNTPAPQTPLSQQ